METLSIFLPASLKVFVDEQVAAGKYRDAGAYLTALVRAARKQKAEEKLLTLVKEAEESGPATPMTREDWNNLKCRVWERHAQAKDSSHGKSRQKNRRRMGSG